MNNTPKRPKNREVEDEMICPPEKEGQQPRPKTEPARPDKRRLPQDRNDKS